MIPLTIKTEIPGMAPERQTNLGAGMMVKVVRRGHSFTAAATLAHRDLLVYKHARRRVRSESPQGNGHGADRETAICPPRRTPRQMRRACSTAMMFA